MKDPNFSMKMQGEGKARIEIYDVIGPSWLGMIDTKLVAKQLKDAGDLAEVEVRINSPGGDAFEGLGIHNVLKDHPAKVTVVVGGVAASAASLIAMAGDVVRIPKNAMLMLHEPSTFAYGTKEAINKRVSALEAVTTAGIETYTAKSKQTPEKVAQWLKDETWFTGQEAVDAGLADTTEKELPLGKAESKAAVQQMFSKAPEQFSSLFALSMRQTEEPPQMADTTKPEAKDLPIAGVVLEAVPQITAADVTSAVQTALAEERTRTSTIMTICQRANHPELANEYIAANMSVADVNAKLIEVLCKDRPPVGDAGGNDAPAEKDPNAAFKAEYAADRAVYQRAGIGEEDYIRSRRIDAGEEPLVTR